MRKINKDFRILFFSGGTALREFSKQLIHHTSNSIHLITAFDSGGSSAEIRKWFNIIAVGDIRNRLLALTDKKDKLTKDIVKLLSYRLSKDQDNQVLREEVEELIKEKHPLIKEVSFPHRKIITYYLKSFYEKMPKEFDLKRASIGNLVLTAMYLECNRDIDLSIFIFSKLINSKGIVRPVVDQNLHIGAILEDNEIVLGQHLITGKEVKPLEKKIKEIFLCKDLYSTDRVEIEVDDITKSLIKSADLICYPMGSFFSSLIATLIPKGISKAISDNPNPKVFVPSTYEDPELFGYSFEEHIRTLLKVLKNKELSTEEVLNFVILDPNAPAYKDQIDLNLLKSLNIKPILTTLITPSSYPKIDPKKLCDALFSIADL